MTVRTLSSGRRPGSSIDFILDITQLSVGDNGRPVSSPSSVRMEAPDYTNGDEVVIRLDDLVIGAVYSFEVSVENEFGRSNGFSTANGLVQGMNS